MRVMIFGAGRFGAVVADVVRSCGHTVVGFVDIDDALVGKEAEPGGARVLMNDDEFFELLDEGDTEDFDAVALAISDNKVRLRLFFELSEMVKLPIFRHPTAVVSSHATVGKATVLLPLSVVSPTATVGRATIVGAGAVISELAAVGDAASIGNNATVCRAGILAERVHIGEGATVGSGVSVGADATLGSSALLTIDADEGTHLVAPSAVFED